LDMDMSVETSQATGSGANFDASLVRISAAVDSHPEGQDAAMLAAAIARATGGDVTLLAIEPDLPLVVPGLDWRRVRRETVAMLDRLQATYMPKAHTTIDTDLSIAQGIERVLRHNESDLVVVGSSRNAEVGEVAIGRHTRQLLQGCKCALAVAARGLNQRPSLELRRIAVGYDGGPEARAALATAVAIATGCDAELIVSGVVDDRIPALGWPSIWMGDYIQSWLEMTKEEELQLADRIEAAAKAHGVTATVQTQTGKPSASLLELSADVDLMIVGSRRWGPLAHLLLGGTGEALMHGACCSVLVVPRPPESA